MNPGITINIKKIHGDAKIPEYKSKEAAGCDFYSLEDVQIAPGETKKIRTGVCIEIPFGHYLRIEDRSGLAVKGVHKVSGIIDSDYRGEILIVLHNHSKEDHSIEKHDRIAQGIVTPVSQVVFREMKELSSTERGERGFHSTGKK